MSTSAGLLLAATLVGAAGLAGLLLGRRMAGSAAVAAGLLLAATAPATAAFPTPPQTWTGVAAAPLSVSVAAVVLGSLLGPALGWESPIVMAGGLLAGPGRVLFTDPFRDPACTSGCHANPIALASRPELASTLETTGTALVVLAVALLAVRLRRDVGAVAACGALMVSAVAAVDRAPTLLTIGPLAVAAVLVTDVRRRVTARHRLDDLVAALASGPADVAALLRSRWGDPNVGVYHRISSGEFVDAHGQPEPATRRSGETVSDVLAGGHVVTRIHHDPRRAEVGAVGAALDQRARLALENDRLAADVAARARVLTEARARLVQTADAERRSLERDLHDSAQQHILALGLELQLAATQPSAGGMRDVLDACRREVDAALEGLREVSHGIYPADLEAGGLGHALRELALRARVPVELAQLPDTGLTADVARAAYAVVDDAVSRSEGPVCVQAHAEDGRLLLGVRGPTRPPREPVVDRVAAFGGTVNASPEGWEVVLPCESS